MKRIIALLTVIALCMPALNASAQTYKDVSEDFWAYRQIERVSAKQWFRGYPDNKFHPDDSITRAEAMTVMVKFLGLELKQPQVSSYPDVDITEWYSPYIEAGKRLFPEIPAFNGHVSFQPDMPMTRETTIYAMVIALKYSDKVTFADQSVLNMFRDQNSISAAIKPYAAVALNLGLVSGYEDDTIRAQDPLTRAEFATLLYRATDIGFGTAELDLSDDNPVVMSVALSVGNYVNMRKGDTLEIAAIATNSDGTTTDYTSKVFAYAANGADIVTANANKVTAIAPGTAEIKFSNDENLKDKSIVVVVAADTASNAAFSNLEYPETTAQSSATISGKVTGFNSAFKLYADGEEIGVASNGAFSVVKSLEVGTNAFVFKAEDSNGTSITQTVKIKRTQAADNNNGNNTNGNNNNSNSSNADNNNQNTEEEHTAAVSGYEWSVSSVNLDVGKSTSVKLFEKYTDGSKKDITSNAQFNVSNTAVAEINANGKITAKAEGTAVITASLSGVSSAVSAPKSLKVTVTAKDEEPGEIKALEWSVESVSLGVGSTKKIKLMAVYDNGTKKDVTKECELYTLDEDIASISSDGTIKGISGGETSVWFDSMPAPRLKLPQVLEVTVE